MLGHKASLSKFQKIEIIIKHLFQPQLYEIRNKLQGKKHKKHKHMKAKQYVTKQPMDH